MPLSQAQTKVRKISGVIHESGELAVYAVENLGSPRSGRHTSARNTCLTE